MPSRPIVQPCRYQIISTIWLISARYRYSAQARLRTSATLHAAIIKCPALSPSRALSLILRGHTLSLSRNASLLSLTEGALLSAVQQVGIILRHMLWISCHLLSNLRSSFFQIAQAVFGRLGGRIVVLSTSRGLCSRMALVDSSKVLCLRRQRAWWWVGLTRSTCFTGVEVGRIL